MLFIGPPLTLKLASSLKWVELSGSDKEDQNAGECCSSSSPFLGMRDGSFLLVRRTGDDPKASTAPDGKSGSVTNGSRSRLGRFSDIKNSAPVREKSLKIIAADGHMNGEAKLPDAPVMPDDQDDGSYSACPTAGPTVRVVQSLHSKSLSPSRAPPAVVVPPLYMTGSVLRLGFPMQPTFDE